MAREFEPYPRLKEGNPDEWQKFDSRFRLPAIKLAREKLTNTDSSVDPEDVVQEAMLKLWLARDRLDEENGNTLAFFLKIVQNASTDKKRSQARKPSISLEGTIEASSDEYAMSSGFVSRGEGHFLLMDPQPSPEDIALQNEVLSVIQDAVGTLPPLQQEVLILQIQGATYPEIAETTNTPLGSAKTRGRLGKDSLQKNPAIVDLVQVE